MKYKVERNRNFDYIYGEFGTGLLFLVGYLIYELTQKSNIIPLLLFIGSAMVLLFLILFLFILTLKRKFVYINTIDDILEYRNYFGRKISIKIKEIDLRYKIMTDNNIQFIYFIVILNKKRKVLFKMCNSEMNLKEQNKSFLELLVEKLGFTPL